MNKMLFFLGAALLFTGIILITASLLQSETKIESAAIIMIGPIPLMFGNSRMLLPLMLTAIVLIVLWFLFSFRFAQ